MLTVWLLGCVIALFVTSALVLRKWRSYSLPIRLVPLDALVFILLFDLNIKSMSGFTVEDSFMKMEALAFTGLLAFVLFVPVLWKLHQPETKPEPQPSVPDTATQPTNPAD